MIFDNPGWKDGQGGDVSRCKQRIVYLEEYADNRDAEFNYLLSDREKERDAMPFVANLEL